MKCPACSTPLVTEVVIGVELDRCPHCQGYWFDDAFTETHTTAGLVAILIGYLLRWKK